MTKGGALARDEMKAKGSPNKGIKKNGPRGKKVNESSRIDSLSPLTPNQSSQWQQLAPPSSKRATD
jgi:hypothetical protein